MGDKGLQKYTIRQGDTLYTIAQRFTGDSANALQIAVLNELDYPFIAGLGESNSGNVKTPGDEILLPIEASASSQATVKTLLSDPDELIYGSDLALSSDYTELSNEKGGELVSDLYGDLQTTSGIKCLEQDLLDALETPYGSLPFHPTYGSNFLNILGGKTSVGWQQKAAVELMRTFKSDPRVDTVKVVDIIDIPTGAHFICDIIPIFGNSFRLNKTISLGG